MQQVIYQLTEGFLGPGMCPEVLFDPKCNVGVLLVKEPDNGVLDAVHQVPESSDRHQVNNCVKCLEDDCKDEGDREQDEADNVDDCGVEDVDERDLPQDGVDRLDEADE